MKRTLLLAALFLLLGAAAWYAITQKNQKTSIADSWDMEFGIPETGDIKKIFIADRKGQTATLVRSKKAWIYNGQFRVRPTAIQSLLETIAQVRVQYVPTEAAKPGLIKSIAAEGIKVEIYDKDDQLMKCYYVGDVTNDERGTYMIMDKSENPYVVQIPSFIGQLRVRYMLGDDNWRDRAVFKEKPEEIEFVSVEYPQQKNQSFRIQKTDQSTYDVQPFYSTTPIIKGPQRKGVPEAYLLQFESLVSEGFENTNIVKDSVRALVPFVIMTVKNKDGEETKARFWPVEVDQDPVTGRTFIVRYFTDLNDGALFMLTQHQVFGPVFRGYPFFFEAGSLNDRSVKN